MKKRIFSVFVAMVLILSAVSMVAGAEGAANKPSITFVTQTSVDPEGTSLKVDINLQNNPGLASTYFKIGYDESVFTLNKVTDGGLLGSKKWGAKATWSKPFIAYWINEDWDPDDDETWCVEDGTIISLTFNVDTTKVVPGKTYAFTLTGKQFIGNDRQGTRIDDQIDIIDGAVTFASEDGAPTPIEQAPSVLPGSYNGKEATLFYSAINDYENAGGTYGMIISPEGFDPFNLTATDTACESLIEAEGRFAIRVFGSAFADGTKFTMTPFFDNGQSVMTGVESASMQMGLSDN